MTVATLKEIKDNENRVGLTPQGVRELVANNQRVIVEKGAGDGSGFSNAEYTSAGAELMDDPRAIVTAADILVKVKEPLPSEYPLLKNFSGKTLFTYLHLSGVDPKLTDALVENNITAIAYETVEDEKGLLPLLAPMSEVAGVLAVQYGAEYLQRKYGGRGITLGAITGTDSARVVVMGGGVVGATAARTATGMGSHVQLFDINQSRVDALNADVRKHLGPALGGNFEAVMSGKDRLDEALRAADLVVGAVLVAGAKDPVVVSEEQVKEMKNGAVVVDVSIDQGGCIWGSRATSHSKPTYELHGKVYCCVPNMPGQVSRQSTLALTAATLPYLVRMAGEGVEAMLKASLKKDGRFAQGLNVCKGRITRESVAKDLGKTGAYTPAKELL